MNFVRMYPCGCEAWEGYGGLTIRACAAHKGRMLLLMDNEVRVEFTKDQG
jgi:hypothetical protein